ncbi:MAG TPA: GNAT family N-acetyltransferase [Thermomicrobiales bacterium]|nr:GNAT family N-acetyltransferase [Thermomicrobiales bacterium]
MTAPAITLRAITPDNLWDVCRLRVTDEQSEFVESNAGSIAQAYVEPSFRPYAIYADDEPVGFTMYGKEESTGRWWVVRLMVDQRYQRKGYGRSAMEALLPMMIEQVGMDEIVTSYVPGNGVAASLYRSLGFVDSGEMDEDEHLMRLSIPDWNSRQP